MGGDEFIAFSKGFENFGGNFECKAYAGRWREKKIANLGGRN